MAQNKTRTCTLKLLDQVNCIFTGIHPDHIGYFYEEYAKYAPNYFFSPKYQLGSWDGRISYFFRNGKTYINLLAEILPRLSGLGYKIKLIDERQSLSLVTPDPIDEDFFKDVLDPFTGEPWKFRKYQIEMVNTLIQAGGGVGLAATGSGKAQPLTSKILTPSGWKLMGDMKTNDEIITPAGGTAKVMGVFPQGNKDVYEIKFHDGASTKCELDHLWKVRIPVKSHTATTEERIITTEEIMLRLERKKDVASIPENISISLVSPIEIPEQELSLDPYLLGALIGDGTLDRNREHLNVLGLYKKNSQYTFIPDKYKNGSISQRFELIRGLMDTNGTSTKEGNMSFTTTSKLLAKDFQEIVWSLGGTCTVVSSYSKNQHKEERPGRVEFTCELAHKFPKQFFRSIEKQNRCLELQEEPRRKVISISKVGTEPTQCILVGSDEHLYVTDDYIVTHNTSMVAAISKSYELAGGYRSMIIVPDKSLNEQTRSSYSSFNLDVGEYSGDCKDQNHQHVVSTWQALQNNPTVIQDYDVIINDETHGARGKVLQSLLLDSAKHVPFRFGVTGTLPKEETDQMAVRITVGDIKYEIPAHVLQKQGHLADLDIDIIQLTEDFTEEYEEWKAENPESKCTYTQFKNSYFPDFQAEKRYLQTKKERVEYIVKYIEKKRSEEKGNVFCLVNGVAFGKKMTKLVDDSVFLHGKDSVDVRKQAYDLFKTQNNVVVFATVNIAATGLDIPRIFNLISIDMGKSFIRTIQTIGRGLRKAPDKDYVHFSDITSNLKYSSKHTRDRIKYYKEAKYKHKKINIDYNKEVDEDDIFEE